jgi:hypothetical protein
VGAGDSVVNVYINTEKKFAFVEFRSVEECSNAMALDGCARSGSGSGAQGLSRVFAHGVQRNTGVTRRGAFPRAPARPASCTMACPSACGGPTTITRWWQHL